MIYNIFDFIKRLFVKDEINKNIPLSELKELWAEEHYPVLSKSGIASYENSWKKFNKLHNKKFIDLRYKDWQNEINANIKACGLHYSSQKKAKNIVGQLYKFANKYDLTNKNYAPLLELDRNIPVHIKEPFSDDEINFLWKNQHEQYVSLVLILIYTGVRISELLRVKPQEDIFIKERYFVIRQSKTEAGRNRPVPINKKN